MLAWRQEHRLLGGKAHDTPALIGELPRLIHFIFHVLDFVAHLKSRLALGCCHSCLLGFFGFSLGFLCPRLCFGLSLSLTLLP